MRYLVLLLCGFGFSAGAQTPLKTDLAPCGSRGISDWLLQYRANPPAIERTDDTLWVGIQAHLLAKDNGTGRMSAEKFLDAFCQLNADFEPAHIQFYFKNDWNLLNASVWHNHSTIEQGINMMLTNNAPDVLNAYMVADPAGNCGYNLPYGGVAVALNCANAGDHTWAHEVGHALSLPHPFIGWEGKLYNYNNPTPLQLTYDYTHFHDSLETQVPAPLDTALVEFVDGSNCAVAADRICDTEPDYLSYRWNCDAQQRSLVKQKDPNGQDFYSDGTLFMSYADDACQSRFSPEEIEVMRATLMTKRAAWVAPVVPEQPVSGLPVAIEPVMDQPAPSNGALLRWASTPDATHYLVQASRYQGYSFKQLDVVTTDTFVYAGQLSANTKYYWRIRPFNYRSTCTDFTTSSTFITGPLSSTTTPDADGWRCYPNPVETGAAIVMDIPESWRGEAAKAELFDASGRLVWNQYTTLHNPRTRLQPGASDWPAGTYYLVLTSKKGVKRSPIVFQRS